MKKILLVLLSAVLFSPILSNAQCTINAGNAITVCAGSPIVTQASAIQFTSYLWSTTGSGTFTTITSLNSSYTPSTADINAGSVTLTITGTGGGCTNASSSVAVTILPLPTINAGTDQTVCAGTPVNLSASMVGATTINWTKSGTGTFSSQTALNPSYTPSTADITAGSVTLTATVISSAGCASLDQVIITIPASATINAGPDKTTCTGTPISLNATMTGGTAINWTTSGTGTFSSQTTANTIYTASAADAAGEIVTLTATVISTVGCTSLDNVTLTILPTGVLYAGPDQFIASGSASLSGTALNTTSVAWTTTGSGTFANTATLSTTYTPSAADIANGIVKITLTSTDNAACAAIADELLLSIGTNFSISGTVTAAANKLDKGVVLLFKQETTGLRFIKSDTIISADAGMYNFDHTPAGTYVLLASPITGSSVTSTFLPTYSGGTQLWNTAQSFTISGNSTNNILLTSYVSADPTWNTGADIISGLITVSANASANARITSSTNPAAFVTVYLTNANGDKIAYTQTDKDGKYSFNNVKAGSYKVAPEFAGTGLPGSATSIPLVTDGLAATVENGSMTLEERSSTSTGILNTTKSTIAIAYPNPAKNYVSIDVSVSTGTGEIKLFNETGAIKLQQQVRLNDPTITVNIESLATGIYLLQVVTENEIYTSKIVKY